MTICTVAGSTDLIFAFQGVIPPSFPLSGPNLGQTKSKKPRRRQQTSDLLLQE